jgi:large repetitive protein
MNMHASPLKTTLKKISVAFILLFSVFSNLEASTFYWVGNGGSWKQYNLHWATTSGGSVFYNHEPTSTDDVVFDANSFTISGQMVRLDTGVFICRNMTWSNNVSFNPGITTNYAAGSTLKVYGSLTTCSAMTWNYLGDVSFEGSTSGNTIQPPAGNLMQVHFRGTGEWILQDSLYCNGFGFYEGTFRSNNHKIKCTGGFSTAGTYNSFYLGTSVVNVSGAWYSIDTITGVYSVASATITAASMTIDSGQVFGKVTLNNSLIATKAIIGDLTFESNATIGSSTSQSGTYIGGNTFNKFLAKGNLYSYGPNYYGDAEFKGDVNFDATAGFDTLYLNNPGKTVYFKSNTTNTLSGTILTPAQACSQYITVKSSSGGTQATISKASGSVTCSYIMLQDIKAQGGATFTANNSFVLSNVTGWTVNAGVSRTLYWIGGSGNWNDASHWSLTGGGAGGACIPTLIDDVVFDANSFTVAGQTMTVNVAAVCRNFSFSGVLFQPTFACSTTSINLDIYGSFSLAQNIIWNFNGIVTFKSSTAGKTINTYGKYNINYVFSGAGSWTLLDSLRAYSIDIQAGTFRSNNKLVRCTDMFRTSSSSNKFLYFGTSTIISNWIRLEFMQSGSAIHADSSYIKCERFLGGNSAQYNHVNMEFLQNTMPMQLFEPMYCQVDTLIFTGYGGINVPTSSTFNYVLFKENALIQGMYNTFVKLECWKKLDVEAPNTYNTLVLNNPSYTSGFSGLQTITGQILANGSCTNGYIIIQPSNGPQGPAPYGLPSFKKTSGTINVDFAILRDVSATGGATFTATNSVNAGNVTGWNFTGGSSRNLYWVGGSGNWSDINHWSLSSGGTGGQCYPTSDDNVTFDNSSFPSGGTLSVNVSYAFCKDVNWTLINSTPSVNNTFPVAPGQLPVFGVYGSFTLNQNVNWNYNGDLRFAGSDSGKTISTQGHAIPGDIYFQGNGSAWVLQDSISCTDLHLYSGKLNTNGKLVRCNFFEANGDTLILGSSHVYAHDWYGYINELNEGTSTIHTLFFNGFNQAYYNVDLAYYPGGGSFRSDTCSFNTVSFSAAGVNFDTHSANNQFANALFNGDATLYGNSLYSNAIFKGNALVYGSNTFDTLVLDNPGKTVSIESGKTQTINDGLHIYSTSTGKINIRSNVTGTQATLSSAIDTMCLDYLGLQDISIGGGTIFYAGLYSSNYGNNSGCIFTSCNAQLTDVWPGDANYDYTVDNNDLLNLGLAYGETGVTRPGATLSWTAQPCFDWNTIFTDFVNVKNADCDGNGVVDSLDLQAVLSNYGQTHPALRISQSSSLHILSSAHMAGDGPDLWLDPTLPSYSPGSWVSLPVKLGTVANNATDIYGTAFTLHYDDSYIENGTVSFSYGSSWLVPAGNIIHAEKDFYSQEQINVAFSRINQANASGDGTVATLHFKIKSGVSGLLNISFSNTKANDKDGIAVPINAISADLNIGNSGTVEISSFALTTVCAGLSTSLPYVVNGTFNPANVFTVQLSDITGNFSNPVSIGTANSTTSGSINITIPTTATPSNHYRIRIISSSPVVYSPSTVDFTISNTPAVPGTISGPLNVCFFKGTSTNVTYSVAAVSDITSYVWTIPTNATLVSVQGTNSISVNFQNSFASGALTVNSTNGCGSSAVNSLALNTIPDTPAPISGPVNACPYIGSSVNAVYSVSAVNGATSYTWTVPTNATLVSGQGTNSINVSFATAFISGNITAKSNSACGSSAVQSLAITKTVPAVPGTISGITSVCAYVNTPANLTYSISPVANATSYTWTVPTNATLVSGQSTTSITVNYLYGFASGNITVKSVSGCGNSSVKTLAVSSTVTAPGAIAGVTNICTYINTPAVASYSVTPVAGVPSYNWTVPFGATIASGQGTNSITVSFSNNFSAGNVTVQSVSNCGSSAVKTLALTSSPSVPGAISGPTNACEFMGYPTMATYSITPIAGAGSYNWSVPNGAAIASGQGASSINVTYYTSFVSGNITVQTIAPCGTSAAKTLAISKTVPATPGTITGPANACFYMGSTANATYSVATVGGTAAYTWTAPTGASIVTGQGTNTITVSYSNSFVSGNISVQSISSCGNSALKTLAITKTAPATPGTITGPLNACLYMGSAANASYSIVSVANAASYNWTVPTGATIASGQGTNTITVSYATSFVSGNVSVQAVAGCGSSAFKTLAITKTIPATPGTITGPANACPYVGGATNATYSIALVSGATSYNWTAPANASVVSGQGTTTVTINYSGSFTSGNLTVQSVAGCGSSAVKTLAITKTIPVAPVTISGPIDACSFISSGTSASYSIAVVSGATSYNWSVPGGATIVSGQGTTNIDVSFSGSYAPGNISVQSVAGCGSSASRTLAVSNSLPATPGLISGPSDVCSYIGTSNNVSYSISPVSGATSYNWSLPPGAAIVSGQGSTNVTVNFSSNFIPGNISVQALSACGTSASSTLAVTGTLPVQPASITGATDACTFIGTASNVSYSISPVSGATSYLWSVPTGANIISGQGTTSIVINYSGSFVPGNIGVQSVSGCGNSSAATLAITGQVAESPASISGPTDACPFIVSATNATYSVTPVNGANSYQWNMPVGATIISGQGSSLIDVVFSSTFTAGNISVEAIASCGNSSPAILPVGNSTPASPSSINGPLSVCSSALNNIVYTTPPVTGATSYNWVVPAGISIVTGQGTNTITVNYSSSFTTGSISVSAGNSCTSGGSTSVSVAKSATPSTPGTIIGLSTNVCAVTGTYSVTALSGVNSYTWTVPAGVTITSGQGTNNISVSYSGLFVSGTISVVAQNGCGSSAAKTLAISKRPATPGTISGPATNACTYTLTAVTYSVAAVSGATSYTWTVPAGATLLSGQGTNTISVNYVSTYSTGILSVVANNSCSSSLARTLTVTGSPATPGTINGPVANVCAATGTYSVVPVNGATSYIWTLPIGVTITSGQSSNIIAVSYDATFTSGTVSVKASNGCKTSATRTLYISKLPATPGIISGPAKNACTYSSVAAIYSIAGVNGAISYTWTVPAGATLVGGQGTNTITVTFASTFTTGAISVAANNNCAAGLATSLTVVGAPATPGTISGPSANVCASTGTYSVAAVSGATSYNWTVPSGITITSGQGTNIVSVSYGGSFTSGTISVKASNGCSTSSARTLSISKIPSTPGTISGPVTNACTYTATPATYSVAVVSGAVSYAWTLPPGVTLINGQGTNAISVYFGGTFTSGSFSVAASNGCATSALRTLSVSGKPATPGNIAGPSTNACIYSSSTATYSVAAVSGATSYSWTVPSGVTLVSGQGTNTITVNFVSTYSTGAISVTANNSCSTSTAKTLTVSGKPATPGTISGAVNGLCGGTSATYSVAPVSGATAYTWAVPANVTITSGQGTNSLSVTIGSSFVSGTISVSASNGCSNSTARTLALNAIPATTAAITGPVANLCGTSNNTYSVAAVSGASGYNWIVSGGTIASGQGTNTITVTYGNNIVSGSVKVAATNACGTSSFKSLALTNCSDASAKADLGTKTNEMAAELLVYPNPSNGDFTISIANTEGAVMIEIFSIDGKLIVAEEVRTVKSEIFQKQIHMSQYSTGMYFLKISGKDFSKTTKVEIHK